MQNQDLQSQTENLERILAKSEVVRSVLESAPKLELPDWYLGAGAVCQTVWNELHGYAAEYGIKDCDLVYFDADISYGAEDTFIQRGKKLFKGLPVEVEVRNEARVHLWYKEKFGKDIQQYDSTEDAINTWPTTATSVGVKYHGGKFVVYAPYGLNDMLSMIVRANKTLVTRDVYEKKAARWQQAWPQLTVIPWDN